MKYCITALALLLISSLNMLADESAKGKDSKQNFFPGNHPNIRFTGRVDYSNPTLPRFWTAGVYTVIAFEGSSCEVEINDEMLWGKNHNYITLVLDNEAPRRMKLTGKTNVIKVADNLPKGSHQLTISKCTEANIGYLELVGIRCKKILTPPELPTRKIEFIGNSITCGTGSDTSLVACGAGDWHDQHNAYMSYGPLTARSLNAQWVLTSASGIGLIHSCCNMSILMPHVFDKVNLNGDTILWNFNNYQPDVVTICLGQNDGIQDSTAFCSAYVDFITRLRGYYPKATIVCLTSPMGDSQLTVALKKYLTAVVTTVNASGDEKVHAYFYSRSYTNGCDYHPTLSEHVMIADELTAFIKGIMKW